MLHAFAAALLITFAWLAICQIALAAIWQKSAIAADNAKLDQKAELQ